jgi:hypothetical protein
MTVTHAPAPGQAVTAPRARHPRTPVVLVLGTVLASLGLVLMGFAGILAFSSLGQRSLGAFATPNERYLVNTHALTLENLDAITGPGSPELGPVLGRVAVRATADPGEQIFIGVAAQSDVSEYLAEVSHSELIEVKFNPFRPQYREMTGSAPPAIPGQQDFWISSAQGPGAQRIQVDLRQGSWAVVVMNADGHAAVAADLQAEVTLPWLAPATKGFLFGGLVLLATGAVLILIGASILAKGGPGPDAHTDVASRRVSPPMNSNR